MALGPARTPTMALGPARTATMALGPARKPKRRQRRPKLLRSTQTDQVPWSPFERDQVPWSPFERDCNRSSSVSPFVVSHTPSLHLLGVHWYWLCPTPASRCVSPSATRCPIPVHLQQVHGWSM